MYQPEFFTEHVQISALGSGSGGNAFVIKAGEEAILVDAGFSRRELVARLDAIGVNPALLRAVLVTHEHDDHVRGCRVFCDAFNLPACIAGKTADFLRTKNKLPRQLMLFEPGAVFRMGSFSIRSFAVQHDAVSPVGFRIECGARHIGIATDLGAVNALAARHLRDCDALILESNYDREMLRNSERRLHLKRRIMGRHGHLDNREAAAVLPELLTDRTKLLLLAHISSECNAPNLVKDLMHEHLRGIGREKLPFAVLEQDRAFPLFDLGDREGLS